MFVFAHAPRGTQADAARRAQPRRLVAAAVLATSLTALATACTTGAGSTNPKVLRTATAGPTSPTGLAETGNGPAAALSASPSPTGPNGTVGTSLTISNGTDEVLMNGTSVNFGVPVNDLSWSQDGTKAVFIDGQGNLDMANPDGSGRVTLALNPGGQTWSHPTWAAYAGTGPSHSQQWTDVIFAAQSNGVQTLEEIPPTEVEGTPTRVALYSPGAIGGGPIPQTGNGWPTASGDRGDTVYQNENDAIDTVYIIDNNLRDATSDTNEIGSDPAMLETAAGGTDIVFVRQVDGRSHLFTISDPTGLNTPTDITPNSTTDCTEPAWSPDGTLIAFSTPDGVETVHADGSDPATVTDTPGFPAYRP